MGITKRLELHFEIGDGGERVRMKFEQDGWEPEEADMGVLDAIEERRKVCGDAWLPVRVFHGDGG